MKRFLALLFGLFALACLGSMCYLLRVLSLPLEGLVACIIPGSLGAFSLYACIKLWKTSS